LDCFELDVKELSVSASVAVDVVVLIYTACWLFMRVPWPTYHPWGTTATGSFPNSVVREVILTIVLQDQFISEFMFVAPKSWDDGYRNKEERVKRRRRSPNRRRVRPHPSRGWPRTFLLHDLSIVCTKSLQHLVTYLRWRPIFEIAPSRIANRNSTVMLFVPRRTTDGSRVICPHADRVTLPQKDPRVPRVVCVIEPISCQYPG